MKSKKPTGRQERLSLTAPAALGRIGGYSLPTPPDVMHPSASLLCKLGSVAVHVTEFLSADGHEFDRAALQTLLDDPELQAWLSEMDKLAFLPKMRRSK